jgi:hypothetical protein
MTLDEMRAFYRVLCLPINGVKELIWYKQLVDLTFDMCLNLNRDNPREEAIILEALREMMDMKMIVENRAKGWKATLHKAWCGFLESGKRQGAHMEFDASTSRWVWMNDSVAADKYDWLLQ